jgi:hypothetical protein
MYEIGDFPSGWKPSMLHMINKGKGDKRDPANYRESHCCQHYRRCIREYWRGD